MLAVSLGGRVVPRGQGSEGRMPLSSAVSPPSSPFVGKAFWKILASEPIRDFIRTVSYWLSLLSYETYFITARGGVFVFEWLPHEEAGGGNASGSPRGLWDTGSVRGPRGRRTLASGEGGGLAEPGRDPPRECQVRVWDLTDHGGLLHGIAAASPSPGDTSKSDHVSE